MRDDAGRMFVGVNLFHFTGGPGAELVALASARANGAGAITHVVAVGNHGTGICSPCGRDRQVLMDLYPSVRVLMPGDVSVGAEDLLPGSYSRPE